MGRERTNLFDLEYGDVFRSEYGDYDNWVSIVFERLAIDDRCIHIWVHHLGKSESFEIRSLHNESGTWFDVIGTESDFVIKE